MCSSDLPLTQRETGAIQAGARASPWGLVQSPRAARMARAIFRRDVPVVMVDMDVGVLPTVSVVLAVSKS